MVCEEVPMVRRRRRLPRPLVTEVSVKNIMLKLDVTLMTIRTWRMGSPERWALPYYRQTKPGSENHRILIEEQDLIEFLGAFRPDLLERWLQKD